jgi:hypothetical protein
LEDINSKIPMFILKPLTVEEVLQHDPKERFISEKEVKEFLGTISRLLYATSTLLKACHKSNAEGKLEDSTFKGTVAATCKNLDIIAKRLE